MELRSTATGSGEEIEAISASSSSRRVQQLLELKFDDGISDLAYYMDHVAAGTAPEGEAAASAPPIPHANELRASLEDHLLQSHTEFFNQFTALYEAFQTSSDALDKVITNCHEIQAALEPHSRELKAVVQVFSVGQRELDQIVERESEIKVIWEQLNFKEQDQELLLKGPVDRSFLEALDRARSVYERSKAMMLGSSGSHSRAYDVGVGTYNAMVSATRLLITFLVTPVQTESSGSSSHLGNIATSASMSADSPELSGLYLRCIRVLYDYSANSWRNTVGMIGDMRRSSVLRRYCHLMATGSATTAAGTYRSGGKTHRDESVSLRPLEADLDKPLFFFRALLAWVHQTTVAEGDLLSNFFFDSPSLNVLADTHAAGGNDSAEMACTNDVSSMMNRIFDHLTVHIESALQGVLERFTAASIGQTSGKNSGGASTNSAKDRLARGWRRVWRRAEGNDPLSPASVAAELGMTEGELRTYAAVPRDQQLQLAAGNLQKPLQAIKEAFDVIQLFEYYHITTVLPLLGSKSKLGDFLISNGVRRVGTALRSISQQSLAGHLTRTTAAAVVYSPQLQRLHDSYLLERKVLQGKDELKTSFLIQFLFLYQDPSVNVKDAVFPTVNEVYHFLDQQQTETTGKDSAEKTGGAAMKTFGDEPFLYAEGKELEQNLTDRMVASSAELRCVVELMQTMREEYREQKSLLQQISAHREMLHPPSSTGESIVTPSLAVTGEDCVQELIHQLPETLSREVTSSSLLRARLDYVCQQLLLLNAYLAVGSLLEPAEWESFKALRDSLRLSQEEVVKSLSEAAIQYYFPVAATQGSDLTNQLHVLREVGYFHSIASSSRVRLPLVAAIEDEKVQGEVRTAVLENVLSHYDSLHQACQAFVAASPSPATLSAEESREWTDKRDALESLSPESLRPSLLVAVPPPVPGG